MNRLSFFLTTAAICLIATAMVQNDPEFPEQEIRELVEQFQGEVGIYVVDLDRGEMLSINADTLFPTASTIKIPIMIGVFDKMEKGELTYTQMLTYDGEHDDTWGNDLINQLNEGSDVQLSRLIHLMMSTSNNTASLWNQHLAGTGTRINDLMDDLGFSNTRVNSRTPGRQEIWETYGWGHSTPRDLAEMMLQIYRGELLSPHASEKMYRIMTRNIWDSESLSEIPPHVNAASKNGSVSRSKAEVVLVNAPSGDYLFCVMTKNQEDAGSADDNEGFVLLRNISGILYDYFEPDDDWSPNPDMQRYWRGDN